jgi:signal transduction histidine kinase
MKFKNWNKIQKLIVGELVERFEDKLLINTTLAISAILTASTVLNFYMGLKSSIVVCDALGIFIYFGLFLFSRFVNRGTLIYWITCITTILYADLIWFFNYGSTGPVLPIFVVLYAFLILVFDKKYFYYISILLYLNLFGLLLVELNFNEEFGNYPDLKSRLLDNYIGMAFSFMIIYSFMAAIKRNYIREYNRAKKSDQLKSAFVANMSHEIRTPLNAIVGFSSLIAEEELSPEQKALFNNQIQRNSDYLLGLIEDIIEVSKIESDQLSVSFRDVDVILLINKLVESFQLTISAEKDLKIIVHSDDNSLVVKADPVRLEQIFRNLLSNAIKFTEKGSIEIGYTKSTDSYTFYVKDCGIGLHPEHHRVIFDRFTKVDNDKQHLYRGTGIGLYLTKQLVEMLGGKIWLESEFGKGACFYFTIPVQPVEMSHSHH